MMTDIAMLTFPYFSLESVYVAGLSICGDTEHWEVANTEETVKPVKITFYWVYAVECILEDYQFFMVEYCFRGTVHSFCVWSKTTVFVPLAERFFYMALWSFTLQINFLSRRPGTYVGIVMKWKHLIGFLFKKTKM